MPEPTTFAIFVVAALALLVTPVPVALYTVARSVDQGHRAGLAPSSRRTSAGIVTWPRWVTVAMISFMIYPLSVATPRTLYARFGERLL